MYVLVGHTDHPMSLVSETTMVLAVSTSEAALEALVKTLENPNPLRGRGDRYTYEGQRFSSVDVVGPVPVIG